MPAIAVQLAVGIAATVPFARRRSVNTGLMASTLWLAGAVTIAGQPIIGPQGAVVGALNGSAQALMFDDVLAVAWGLSGTFLYMYYLYPDRMRRERHLRGGLLLGHLLILLALLALAGAASADPQVTREGVWFPVRAGMPPAALAYGLTGKIYILGMQVWACIGCWQAMRRLPFSAMRAAIAFGFCVASAIFVQGLAVTIAQARGQQFFAPPNGPRLDALWLSIGLLCPLAAFSVAGALRRFQLLILRRDLLVLRKRLLNAGPPEDKPNTTSDAELSSWTRTLTQPVADVDELSIEIRDLLTARYPVPTEATALAGVWLWRQPPVCVSQLSERDIALLLLGATVFGIEQGVTSPVPLDVPDVVFERFEEDSDWNIPADARFLQTVERLLEGKPTPSTHTLVGTGLRDVYGQLRSKETIAELIEEWIGHVELAQREDDATQRQKNGVEGERWVWWRPPTPGAG